MAALTKAKGKKIMPEVEANVTFEAAAQSWLVWAQTRNRKPIRESSVPSIRSALDKWICPHLGKLPLSNIHNGTVKHLVSAMKGANLSPKTIQTYTALVKSIVASVIDEETGEPVFNRKWNASVLDLPIVENQKQPCFTKMEIQKMLRNSCGWERVLYLILASTGLRIGEALGLESKHVVHVVNGGTTLRVEQQVNRFGEIVPYTKTRAGMREVDLCSEVSGLIRLQAKMANGLLFATRNGTPHLSGNVEKRRLRGHTEKGFHAFRRFRNTHLREMNALPDLIVFWMGHSAKGSMTEVYSKLSTNLKARQAEAERVGLGFKIVQTYREIQAEELELAAD